MGQYGGWREWRRGGSCGRARLVDSGEPPPHALRAGAGCGNLPRGGVVAEGLGGAAEGVAGELVEEHDLPGRGERQRKSSCQPSTLPASRRMWRKCIRETARADEGCKTGKARRTRRRIGGGYLRQGAVLAPPLLRRESALLGSRANQLRVLPADLPASMDEHRVMAAGGWRRGLTLASSSAPPPYQMSSRVLLYSAELRLAPPSVKYSSGASSSSC